MTKTFVDQKNLQHKNQFDHNTSLLGFDTIEINLVIFHLKLKISLKINLYFSRKNEKTGKLFCMTPGRPLLRYQGRICH